MLDAAAGLTRYEAENAFSLSLVRHSADRTAVDLGTEVPDAKEKRPASSCTGAASDSPTWAAWRPSRASACGRCGTSGQDPHRAPGAPALGRAGDRKVGLRQGAWATRRAVPRSCLDIGALMGSLVGQTEANIRQALRIADAMAPVHPDHRRDREGALSGVASSGSTDSRRRRPGCSARFDLAQRPRKRRVLHRHLQRHLANCRRSSQGRRGSTAYSSWTCPACSRSGRSGSCTSTCSSWTRNSRSPSMPSGLARKSELVAVWRPLLDVPLVEAAQERGARGHDGCRIGLAAADLGQRPVSQRRCAGRHLHRQSQRRRSGEAGPQGAAGSRPPTDPRPPSFERGPTAPQAFADERQSPPSPVPPQAIVGDGGPLLSATSSFPF